MIDPILEFARQSPDVIDPREAADFVRESGARVIDVRGTDELDAGHVPGAENVPLPGIVANIADLPEDKAAPIVTFCKVGERSLHAMLLLKSLGYQRVRSVRGGLGAWTAAGLPVET